MLAERLLDIEVLKEIHSKKMVSAPGRRLQVIHARKRWKLPLRRACARLSIARSSARYASKREVADAPVVTRVRELAAQYPRYGYRRIRIFLGRDGHRVGVDRAHRLWRTSRLQVPRKRPRRRFASSRPKPMPPTGPNYVGRTTLVFDACADGEQLIRANASPSTSPAASALAASSRCWPAS
jgi:putative transposase